MPFVNSPVFQSVLLSVEEISFFVTFSDCLLPMQRNVPFSSFKINAFAFFNKEKVFKVIYLYIFVWKILSG